MWQLFFGEFIFWSFDLVPEAQVLLTACGRVRITNYHFQQDDALQWLQKSTVVAEDQREDLAQNADQCCKSLQRAGSFVPFASSWGHNLQHMAGWSVTEVTGTLTWLKEELPKHLRFHCSCCKIRRNYRRIGMDHDHIWHQPQQMPRDEYGNRGNTRKPSCPFHPPPSLSPPLAQGHCLLGLPRKDKAEIVSPTDVVLWPAPPLCSTPRTQPRLSHPGRGSPGNGSSPFPTQKPPWLQETSPEGFKALCNYWPLQCNYQHQDSAKAQFLGIQDLYWKYPQSRQSWHLPLLTSFSGTYSHISQHRTSTFLSVRDRHCSVPSEQH